MEYCERHLEGHLGIIAVFLQVLDEPGNQACEMFIGRLQQLLEIVGAQLRRIEDMSTLEVSTATINTGLPILLQTEGRPKYLISKDQIERLHSCGMTWTYIAKVLHISERSLYRRRQEYGILEVFRHIRF